MKKLLLVVLILLLSTQVSSIHEYTINNIECFGDMLIQVNNIQGSTNYTFENCMFNETIWNCDCKLRPKLYNILNETTTISFRIQYNIAQPKNDNIYNQEIKRVITKTITLTKDEVIDTDTISNIMGDAGQFIIIIVGIVLFIIVCSITWFIIFLNIEKFKRWLGVDINKPMTFWQIVVAIFTRSSIRRRNIQKIEQQKSKEDVDENIEKEVNDLIKQL